MPSCYLAGPMRHKPRYNFPAFFRADEALTKLGWTVYNPAQMDVDAGAVTREGKLRKKLSHGKVNLPEASRGFALRDIGVLIGKLRAENGDAIVLLPGWRRSTGAKAERAIAKWVGLRILRIEEALAEGKQ